MRVVHLLMAGCLGVLLVPVPGRAQTATGAAGPPEGVPVGGFQLGPVTFGPTLAISNIGRDTNVFNSSTGQQSDFTATVVPGLNTSIGLGRAHLTARSAMEYLYFQNDVADRSVDFSQSGQVAVSINRVTPRLGAQHLSTNQRPNDEIDQRVSQQTNAVDAGFDVIVGPEVSLGVTANQQHVHFGDAVFNGVNLDEQLSRDTTSGQIVFRDNLTSLTTFTLEYDLGRDRFSDASERNDNSMQWLAGFEFKPTALISGAGRVGYKRFTLVNGDAPNFDGVVTNANLAYILRDATRFGVIGGRDVGFSYETDAPYFVTDSAALSVTQVLGGEWDTVLQYGRTWLHYRGLETADPDDRTDRTTDTSVGLEYRLARGMRIGFNVEYVRRSSAIVSNQYQGYRFGGSFSYGQ